MTASISLRRAEEGDLAAIVGIENATFSQSWRPETFAAMLGQPETDLLVAAAGPSVVGYVVLTTGDGEAELANLAVSPAYRRRGVGEALLQRSLEALRGRDVRRVYLAVRASNEGAVRLYEHFGFREIGSQKFYYQEPPEDARIFAMEVPPFSR